MGAGNSPCFQVGCSRVFPQHTEIGDAPVPAAAGTASNAWDDTARKMAQVGNIGNWEVGK